MARALAEEKRDDNVVGAALECLDDAVRITSSANVL